MAEINLPEAAAQQVETLTKAAAKVLIEQNRLDQAAEILLLGTHLISKLQSLFPESTRRRPL